MQSDSSSLDTLKDNLLRAVDAEYNVMKAEVVLDIICQLEKMEISKDQLQATRLGREINTIRQKIDAKKKTVDTSAELIIEIAQRAKKLLRSWQGLLNTSQTDSVPSTNGESKPRLILKVKFNSSLGKRKRESDAPLTNGTHVKRKKTQVIETPTPLPTSVLPVKLTEANTTLPRLKTTQQLLLEMQRNEPSVLSTQTSTINAILQKKILDETLHETVKVDYSALHSGRDLHHINSTHFSKQLSSSVTSPSNTNTISGSSSKRLSVIRRPSSTFPSSNSSNWENGSSAGSPISPLSSSSSSSLGSTASLPLPVIVPEPPLTAPVLSRKKRRKKDAAQPNQSAVNEQSVAATPDVTTTCASYKTIADLVEAHRRRILAEHDTRELEARPELLLVPIDQLAFVYERVRAEESDKPAEVRHSSITDVERLDQPLDLIALPFIDCPFEFDFILDELVVQQPTLDM